MYKGTKNGQQKTCNLFCNIACKTSCIPDLLQDRFYVGGKTRNIACQLVLQQCCKTSCSFFVTRFYEP